MTNGVYTARIYGRWKRRGGSVGHVQAEQGYDPAGCQRSYHAPKDGWGLLYAIQSIVPGIPVILTSGYNQNHVMNGDHKEQSQSFLSKPVQVGRPSRGDCPCAELPKILNLRNLGR